MDGFVSAIADNWFALFQTIGILAGLAFTSRALRMDARTRKAQMLVEITEQHRSIWLQMLQHPSLKRILRENADLSGKPPTVEETLFVNLILLHFASVMNAVRQKAMPEPGQSHLN